MIIVEGNNALNVALNPVPTEIILQGTVYEIYGEENERRPSPGASVGFQFPYAEAIADRNGQYTLLILQPFNGKTIYAWKYYADVNVWYYQSVFIPKIEPGYNSLIFEIREGL